MQRSWRQQFLPTAVTHPQPTYPELFTMLWKTLCVEGEQVTQNCTIQDCKSALHRQVENWYCFSSSIPPSGAVGKPLGQVEKGLGSSQVSCLQPWSDPEAGHLCVGVTKVTMANGHSGSLAKGATVHDGSKWIFALAPWVILFFSWHLVTLGASGSVSPEPCPHPTGLCPSSPFLIPNFPLPFPCLSPPHTHTHTRAFYTQNETSQQKLQSSRGIFTERKAQIPKPALLFTQISSPALKLYLSKAVPSFLETGKLFQGVEIVHMFWHWKFYIKLLSFRKVLKHRKNTEKQL